MGDSVLENYREAHKAVVARRDQLRELIETSQRELREIEAEIFTRPGDTRPLRERLLEFLVSMPGALESDIGAALGVNAVHSLAPLLRKGVLRAEGKRGEYRFFVVET